MINYLVGTDYLNYSNYTFFIVIKADVTFFLLN